MYVCICYVVVKVICNRFRLESIRRPFSMHPNNYHFYWKPRGRLNDELETEERNSFMVRKIEEREKKKERML